MEYKHEEAAAVRVPMDILLHVDQENPNKLIDEICPEI
jgi:hypothetical protein